MRSTESAALVSAVDALAAVDVEQLCAAELQDLIATAGPQVDRLSGVLSAAVGSLEVRTGGKVASAPRPEDRPEGASGPVVAVRHWLRDTLGCGGSTAGGMVRVAVQLRELPLVATAVRDGAVGAEQARILTRFLGCVALEQLQDCQLELIEVAARLAPEELARWVRHMIATWCEPQHEHDDRTAQNKRYLQTRDQGDGTTRGGFVLSTESLESFFTVLEPLARPAGLGDTRSAGQRRADALVEVFDLTARLANQPRPRQPAEEPDTDQAENEEPQLGEPDASAPRDRSTSWLPDAGGLRPNLFYVLPAGWAAGQPPPPFAELVAGILPDRTSPPPEAGCAIGVWTGPASRGRIETLLCDARISRALLQPDGQIANLESVRGEITPAQRRALIARDRGCAHRGCTRPPAFCDAHHLTAREDGGDTTLDNLILLCRRHHLLWHQGRVQLRDLHVPWLIRPIDTGSDPPGRSAA